jgi:hypothetical protein
MKKEIRDKWLAALRSGEYEQTTGILRNTTPAYCCLGVLCEVAGVPRRDIKIQSEYDFSSFGHIGISACNLPDHFLGITVAQESRLISMNDLEGQNFTAIADWIEANIPAD